MKRQRTLAFLLALLLTFSIALPAAFADDVLVLLLYGEEESPLVNVGTLGAVAAAIDRKMNQPPPAAPPAIDTPTSNDGAGSPAGDKTPSGIDDLSHYIRNMVPIEVKVKEEGTTEHPNPPPTSGQFDVIFGTVWGGTGLSAPISIQTNFLAVGENAADSLFLIQGEGMDDTAYGVMGDFSINNATLMQDAQGDAPMSGLAIGSFEKNGVVIHRLNQGIQYNHVEKKDDAFEVSINPINLIWNPDAENPLVSPFDVNTDLTDEESATLLVTKVIFIEDEDDTHWPVPPSKGPATLIIDEGRLNAATCDRCNEPLTTFNRLQHVLRGCGVHCALQTTDKDGVELDHGYCAGCKQYKCVNVTLHALACGVHYFCAGDSDNLSHSALCEKCEKPLCSCVCGDKDGDGACDTCGAAVTDENEKEHLLLDCLIHCASQTTDARGEPLDHTLCDKCGGGFLCVPGSKHDILACGVHYVCQGKAVDEYEHGATCVNCLEYLCVCTCGSPLDGTVLCDFCGEQLTSKNKADHDPLGCNAHCEKQTNDKDGVKLQHAFCNGCKQYMCVNRTHHRLSCGIHYACAGDKDSQDHQVKCPNKTHYLCEGCACEGKPTANCPKCQHANHGSNPCPAAGCPCGHKKAKLCPDCGHLEHAAGKCPVVGCPCHVNP